VLTPPDIEGTRAFEPIEDLGPRPPKSKPVGAPNGGRLRHGVQLPASSESHFTFDSALRRSPSRGWRRWATQLTLQRTQRVLDEYHAAHPTAARVGVGDLSRPTGGPFGRNYGGLGHASHQNGRDVDLYWPRRDRRERPPRNVKQVDRKLAQDLVDRFVDAGAELVFVGPRTKLRGPKGVVHVLVGHDDHVHVRWPAR
jgi:murein endopeptidase